MRIKVLNASVAVLMTAGVVTAAPSAAADDWKVEGDGDSAGISHRQEILIQSDPVPEVGGGSYEGGSGGGEGVVEQEQRDPCAGVPEARWIVLGVVEGLNPWKDEDHARTQEVPR